MNDTAKVVFGELPPNVRKSRGGKWASIAEQLRARPGEWAKVHASDTANRAATLISAGRAGRLSQQMPTGEFEFARGGNDVWARFVGEVQS